MVASLRTETFRGDVSRGDAHTRVQPDQVDRCWLSAQRLLHGNVLIKASFHNVLCRLSYEKSDRIYPASLGPEILSINGSAPDDDV